MVGDTERLFGAGGLLEWIAECEAPYVSSSMSRERLRGVLVLGLVESMGIP